MQNFAKKSLEKSLEIISCFLGQKVQKSLETGVLENSEFTKISKFSLFRTFQKLQKWRLTWTSKIAKKLVPTQKLTGMFGLKFGMQGLTYHRFGQA